jgi:nucleoside-diphosphate-sugar epimerase
MRVMVTGGTGFTGSHSVRAFVAAGHSVRLLVRDPAKVRRVYDPHGIAIPEADVIVGDITDEASVERAMAGCDAVFHGAALVEMKRKMASQVLATNRRGVELVVGGAVKRGLPSIVYVSSVAIFFVPGCGPLDLDMPIAEGHTAYAKSKSEAEHAIRRMQEEGAPIRVSYPTAVIGPDDPGLSEANQAVYTFLKQTGVNTSSGFQIVDVRDLAALHAKLLELPGGAHRYVAAGPMHTWPDTYRILDEVTGKWIRRFPVPGPLFRALGTVGDWIEMKKIVSPASYRLAPADMAQSPAVNVAQAYARYAAAMRAGAVPAPDFDHAVVRHALIDALERSHAEGRVIKLG